MPFGAKTVKDLLADIESGKCGEVLDVTGNASVSGQQPDSVVGIATALKANPTVKRLVMTDCALVDASCAPLADLFANNHTLEEVILEKNKISSHGAKVLAQGLASNRSIRTLNLLQQAVKSFGDECLDAFVEMYGTNITLTKLTWRLDSRKSFMLAKLLTRNIEIQKRIREGKEFSDLLPNNLRTPASAGDDFGKRRSSVKEMEDHVADITSSLQDASLDDASGDAGDPDKVALDAVDAPDDALPKDP